MQYLKEYAVLQSVGHCPGQRFAGMRTASGLTPASLLTRYGSSYRDWTASALWSLTHSQSPWRDAYQPGSYRRQISDDAMTSYFRAEVPLDKRVLHPSVVVVDRALLDDLNDQEEEIVKRAVNALR